MMRDGHSPDSSPCPASHLHEDDVRAIVRMISDIAASGEDLTEKRRILVGGIASLIQADAWYWAMMGNQTPGVRPTFAVYLKSGFGEEQFAAYLKALEHPDMRGFNEPLLADFASSNGHITRLYQQIDPERRFAQSEASIGWAEANLGPFIFSLRANSTGQTSLVALFRYAGKPLFSERESRIAHILLSEVAWLHDTAWTEHPTEQVFRLSPRLHSVLNLLLQGQSRKEIATQLAISPHTLGGYIKEIYMRFGVQSQASLVSRFFQGDGGDAPASG